MNRENKRNRELKPLKTKKNGESFAGLHFISEQRVTTPTEISFLNGIGEINKPFLLEKRRINATEKLIKLQL